MNDKTMARADFFKYVVGRTASLVGKATEDLTIPLSVASDVAASLVTKPLISIGEYDGAMKLLTSCKPPLFLVGEPHNNLIAILALCEKDNFLLSYQPQYDSFYCSACGERHELNRSDGEIKTDLKAIPLVIREGKICLLCGS
jgi:hypothetical protein